jgi:hypothetical protein
MWPLQAAALMFAEPFARGPFCAYTGLCPYSPNAKAWNKIDYDVAVAALVSSVFYFHGAGRAAQPMAPTAFFCFRHSFAAGHVLPYSSSARRAQFSLLLRRFATV